MVKNDISCEVISDSSPIIHLDEMQCLDLLSDFKRILIVPTVSDEIIKYRPQLLKNIPQYFCNVDPNPYTLDFLTVCNIFSLDSGEMQALNIMAEYPHSIFLTDDASARLVADKMGYKVHGTLGVIIRAIRRNQKSKQEVLNLLKSIPHMSSLYIKQSLLNKVIKLVENS